MQRNLGFRNASGVLATDRTLLGIEPATGAIGVTRRTPNDKLVRNPQKAATDRGAADLSPLDRNHIVVHHLLSGISCCMLCVEWLCTFMAICTKSRREIGCPE